MFDFLGMLGTAEERAIARFENGELIVDTCQVNDSSWSCETAISHLKYNHGKWVIVAGYDDLEAAKAGHQHWVEIMTASELPTTLVDVSTASTAMLTDVLGADWRECRREEDEDE